MSPDRLELSLPPLNETRHSREGIVRALREEESLPEGAVALAAGYADHIVEDIVAVLERATAGELDSQSANLLFRGIHILGGRRKTGIFQPLIKFLHGPQRRVEDLLGDAITETLIGILAGAFDGDVAALYGLVKDRGLDLFVRDAALRALVLLSFDRRIDGVAFESFLGALGSDASIARSDDVMWHAWMSAIGVLGMERLVPSVRAAFADGRITSEFCDEKDFDALLAQALARPQDLSRLADEHIRYIDDVLMTLQSFHWHDTYEGDDRGAAPPADPWALPPLPLHNPLRGVGRNDPCPCGSGKKAKKCCLT